MKKPAGTVLHITTPLKTWAPRFALFILVGAAFALMLLGKADTVLVERARSVVADTAAPILDLISRPVGTVNDFIEETQSLADVRSQNALLKQQNERLLSWQAAARRLEAENNALRDLMNLAPDPGQRFVTARVIGDQGGAFVRSVLVNAGRRNGVAKGQAAVTGLGLAGRSAEVGIRSSRVLLITDMNSRIPILVGDNRDRSIMAGDNSDQPRLLYLSPRAKIAVGDRVITSGHGGVFPPGLPVGVVTQVTESGIRVQPYVDWGHMEYLRLVDYELPRTLMSSEGDDQPGPKQ